MMQDLIAVITIVSTFVAVCKVQDFKPNIIYVMLDDAVVLLKAGPNQYISLGWR